jgi:transposase InsO family protein
VGRVSEGTKAERFGFVADHHSDFGIRYLCEKLHVTYQGYYKWLEREESARDKDNKRLFQKIQQIFDKHNGNYGSPRIHAALRDRGELVNHKRVERLMRENSLVGKAGRIYRRKPLPDNSCIKVANIQRDLGMPTKPNQQWAGDVTYLKVNGQWQYLAVIIDLYSRKIIGWALSNTRTVALTLAALNKAARVRKRAAGLIFHSDRGSEYGAHAYQKRLRKLGITPSMNRAGYMNDNIYVETFFQTLKTESSKGLEFESVHELRMTLAWYMESYYNKQRLHGSLGFCNPNEYERMAA